MNKQQRFRNDSQGGFTVIELIVVIILIGVSSILIFRQIQSLDTARDDSTRKTSINAMYYALEEVYYKEHKSYPATLKSSTLPSIDPTLFTDPDGYTLGKEILSDKDIKQMQDGTADPDTILDKIGSFLDGTTPNYHYDATDCDQDGNCKGYKLQADLVGESAYVKTNRKH